MKQKKLLPEFRKIEREHKNVELVCTKTDGTKYDFNRFLLPFQFIEKNYNYEITLNEAINDQTEFKILINKLNNDYNPRRSKKAKEKKRVLESAKKLFDARDEIINLLKKKLFRIKLINLKQKKKKNQKKTKFLNKSRINQKVLTMICLKNNLIFQHLLFWQKKLFETKDKKQK